MAYFMVRVARPGLLETEQGEIDVNGTDYPVIQDAKDLVFRIPHSPATDISDFLLDWQDDHGNDSMLTISFSGTFSEG